MKVKTDQRCCKRLYGYIDRHCTRTGVVKREGKWYCKQHDPVAVSARIKKRDAKWQAAWDARDTRQARNEALHAAERTVIMAAKAVTNHGASAIKTIDALYVAVHELERLEKLQP